MDLYGIKQVYLCKLGYLKKQDVPSNSIVAFGLNKSHSLVIADDDQVKTYREQVLPNKINFKAEFESLQTNISTLYTVFIGHYLPDGGCDVEIVTNNGLVFDFTKDGDKNLGIEVEFVLSDKERLIRYALEGSFDYRVGKEIINSAATNQPITNIIYNAHWYYRRPDFKYINIGTIVLEKMEVVSRKLSLKTIGPKNAYKQTIPRYVEVTLELVLNRSNYQKLANIFNQGELVSCTFEDYDEINNNNQKVIRFVAYGLGLKNEAAIKHDANELKVTLVNRYPYNAIQYSESGNNFIFTFNN